MSVAGAQPGPQPGSFKSSPADPLFGGARFDATDTDLYPYYYAALDENTAIAETFLRDLEPDEEGMRAIPRKLVTGRVLSGLTLTKDLELVSLVTGQDLGLDRAGQLADQRTRPRLPADQGVGALAPRAGGVGARVHLVVSARPGQPGGGAVWRPLRGRFLGRTTRGSCSTRCPNSRLSLTTRTALVWLNRLLEPYRAAISPP